VKSDDMGLPITVYRIKERCKIYNQKYNPNESQLYVPTQKSEMIKLIIILG